MSTPHSGSKTARRPSQGPTISFSSHHDAASQVKSMCEKHEGSVLQAWLKTFDPDHNINITVSDFSRAFRNFGFTNMGTELFKVLDEDGSGGVSLDEVDPVSANLWTRFRKLCVDNFLDVKDMLQKLGGRTAVEQGEVSYADFGAGLVRFGWVNEKTGDDVLICKSLDKDRLGVIPEQHLSFLTIEKNRILKKDLARQMATKERRNDFENPIVLARARDKFKRYLKRKFGGIIRAWRSTLCPNDRMSLQKVPFLKACANIGYNDDVKLLWKAFDKDDNGVISIDELDLTSAELLADFKSFVKVNFGNATSAFHALDMDGTRRVPYNEFAKALKHYNFHRPAKALFEGLDRFGRKILVEDDLKFLDDWKPLPFLTSQPNQQAGNAFKELLLSTYKTYLKGWRRCLDVDMDNHCTWAEFEAGCKKIGFRGDVPGAWRSLDTDLTGYITLMQIDPVTSKALADFRIWAISEFGGIRSAFAVFDEDGSKEIVCREFVRCCHIYGFEGNAKAAFHALDVNRDKSIKLKELLFLEHWVSPQDDKNKVIASKAQATQESDVDVEQPSEQNIAKKRAEKLRQQMISDRLSRPDSARRKPPASLPQLASSTAAEEEIEPMVLVTMELAEPLYSHPPYKLARSFRPRPATRDVLAPIEVLPWTPPTEQEQRGSTAGQYGLQRCSPRSAVSSTRSLASYGQAVSATMSYPHHLEDAAHIDAVLDMHAPSIDAVSSAMWFDPERDPPMPQRSARNMEQRPHFMPTLDDLLPPPVNDYGVYDRGPFHFERSHHSRGRRRASRRGQRSRGRGKAMAIPLNESSHEVDAAAEVRKHIMEDLTNSVLERVPPIF